MSVPLAWLLAVVFWGTLMDVRKKLSQSQALSSGYGIRGVHCLGTGWMEKLSEGPKLFARGDEILGHMNLWEAEARTCSPGSFSSIGPPVGPCSSAKVIGPPAVPLDFFSSSLYLISTTKNNFEKGDFFTRSQVFPLPKLRKFTDTYIRVDTNFKLVNTIVQAPPAIYLHE